MNKNSSEEQLWTVMSELIAHGADMHAVSSKYTILDLAAMNGKWMLAEKLIGLGATFSSNFAKRTTLLSSPYTLDTIDLPYLHSLLHTISSTRQQSAAMAAASHRGEERQHRGRQAHPGGQGR
jgi:hypothetical protein